ncbi:unnamed protein product [Orchesella dallaii]|uniref:Odorant receptor n=1 Tax=Orchesella dallaii TaxID=48710 RepID=A0ABP1PT48_9HEXA
MESEARKSRIEFPKLSSTKPNSTNWQNIFVANIKDHVRFHAKLCKLPIITPFLWDNERELLRVNKFAWKVKKSLVLSIHLCIVIAMLSEIVAFVLVSKNADKFAALLRIVFFCLISCPFLYHQHAWSDSEGLCTLLNCIAQFNQLKTGNLDTLWIRTILTVMQMSMFLATCLVTVLMAFCPDFPPFPSSLLVYVPQGWLVIIIRMVVTTIQVWNVISWMCHAGLILCCALLCNGAMYIGVHSLTKYPYPSNQSLKKYRQLLLLGTYINLQFRKSIQLALLMAVIALGILCFSATIKCHAEVSFMVLGIIILITVNAVVASSLMAAIPGKVNGMSKELLNDWKPKSVKGRLDKKTVRSLREIKLQFGTANYFERNTCLAVMDFQIEKTVDLLLLFK